jgi:hypothetical protein
VLVRILVEGQLHDHNNHDHNNHDDGGAGIGRATHHV